MGNSIELLKLFAQSQGIDIREVDKFMNSFDTPKTLADLANLPTDLLEHYDYITHVPQPLQDFISDEMTPEKYETVDLDQVLECIDDRRYHLEDEDPNGYYRKKFTDEEIAEKLKNLVEVEKCVIATKFGSVENDW